MNNAAATAVRIEPTIAGQDNPFMVGSRLEITHILQAIAREASLITVNLDAGDFFLTSLLAVDENAGCMYLERGRSQPRLPNALQHRKLMYSTMLDKVQIRFGCVGIDAVTYAGTDAYEIPLPAELLRIQRREFYRIRTPITSPAKCRISADESTGDARVELNLCDISCGGVAVQSPPSLFTPELGITYACDILLPSTPALKVQMQARNAFMVTLLNGKITQRSGFAFVNPAENMVATVQRYILLLERQRRLQGGRDS